MACDRFVDAFKTANHKRHLPRKFLEHVPEMLEIAADEELRLFRSIATMNPNAPLPDLRNQRPTWDKAAALAREWQLKQLAERLEGLG